MGRSPCCSKEGMNRGAWTALEDKILTAYIKAHGEGKWRNLPKRAGLKRCGKSCRLRWLNYLRPDIKRGNISHDEEELIIRLHNLLGNRWSLIAGRLPGRTDNEIKNYWNTTLGKKAGAQAQSSSPTCNRIPINKSRERKPTITNPKTANSPAATTQAQAIRTKAFKCTTKVHIPIFPPLNYNYPATNSTGLISVEPQAHRFHMKNPCDSDNLKMEFGGEETNTTSDFNNLGCDEVQASDDDAKEKSSRYNCNFSMVSAHPLTFDQSMFEDWTTVNCLEDNATLDLGSFSFLLDSEEWP